MPEAAGALQVRSYIRNEAFDTTLLVAPAATGLAAATVVAASPLLFPVTLFADLWLLGYHHVIATYTRLAFDLPSLRRNRFLAVDALLLVTAVTLLVTFAVGPWDQVNVLLLGGGLAVTTGIYMGINFHHYVVDALIWKRGRRAAPAHVGAR